jgi:hypothetical protein
LKTTFLAFAPGVALGLFVGRLLSELWALQTSSTSLWMALALTMVTAVAGGLLLRHAPFSKTWPLLLLLLYVFFPEASFLTAFAIGLLTFFVWWQVGQPWLRMPEGHWGVFLAALTTAVFFFFLYFFTLAPDLLPADNGEFQLVATNLGVAHPPGFTLYTMLGHLMTRLPLGPTPAYRVNLLSAITSALTLALVYGIVYLLTKKHLAALTAAVALGTATTFWAQSTTANIRSLSALFAALIFLVSFAYYRASCSAYDGAGRRRADYYLMLLALALGLGISHHASLAFLGLVALLFVLLADPSLLRSPQRWWRPFLAFLIGLLPLLYLPLRAASTARGASPELATWPGFLEHVLALGFRGDLFTYLEPALLWERLKIMGNVLTFQFEPWLLLGMILGLLLLLARDWRLALLFGGAFALFTFVTATYRAPQTVEYMLPAYIPLAILLGYGVGASSGMWQQLRIGRYYLPLREILLAILLVLALGQLAQRYPSYAQLHRDTSARDYAQPLLQEAPQEAVILADWHWVTPLWYLQEVEGQRLDVSVRFVFPEGEPYGQTWARRIGEEVANGRPVISTHFDADSYAGLPLPEPLLEVFLFRQEPRMELPDGYVPLELKLDNSIQLLGYKLAAGEIEIGRELLVTVAWQPLEGLQPGTNLFAHLASSYTGDLYAQQDVPALAQAQGITLTQLRLTPRLGTLPGKYTLLVGAYGAGPLLNEKGEPRTTLATLGVSSQAHAQATLHPLRRTIAGERDLRLLGYDWDHTLPERPRLYLHWQTEQGFETEVREGEAGSLPPYSGPWGVASNRWSWVTRPANGQYVPLGQGLVWHGDLLDETQPLYAGQNLTMYQHFLSSRPVLRDHAVSVRLIGFEEDGFHWSWWDLDDSIPAMGAIPTLKWIGGSQVRSPHFVTVDENATGGQQIGGALNLYDAFTGRRLPILDERLTAEYGWVPLGQTAVEEYGR